MTWRPPRRNGYAMPFWRNELRFIRILLLPGLLCLPAGAQEAAPTSLRQPQPHTLRILVQSSPLAGFQYHEAGAIWHEMKAGDALQLRREPDNAHDAHAIRVEWRGRMLGYLPRAENRAVATQMDRPGGDRIEARIARLREHPNPWQRVLVEVFVVL